MHSMIAYNGICFRRHSCEDMIKEVLCCLACICVPCRRYQDAKDLYCVIVLYANMPNLCGSAARMVAACDISLEQWDSAAGYLNMAEQHEPGMTVNHMLLIRLHLHQGHWQAVQQDLWLLPRAIDFNPMQHLQVGTYDLCLCCSATPPPPDYLCLLQAFATFAHIHIHDCQTAAPFDF